MRSSESKRVVMASRIQVLTDVSRGKTEGIMLPGVLERRAVWVSDPTKPEHDTDARVNDHG